jgi:hypothetical protein
MGNSTLYHLKYVINLILDSMVSDPLWALDHEKRTTSDVGREWLEIHNEQKSSVISLDVPRFNDEVQTRDGVDDKSGPLQNFWMQLDVTPKEWRPGQVIEAD